MPVYQPDCEIEICNSPEVVVIRRNIKHMIQRLDPVIILPFLPCLTQVDEELVTAETNRYGPSRGSILFFNQVIRRSPDIFWNELLNAFRDDYILLNDLADTLENDLELYKQELGAKQMQTYDVNDVTPNIQTDDVTESLNMDADVVTESVINMVADDVTKSLKLETGDVIESPGKATGKTKGETTLKCTDNNAFPDSMSVSEDPISLCLDGGAMGNGNEAPDSKSDVGISDDASAAHNVTDDKKSEIDVTYSRPRVEVEVMNFKPRKYQIECTNAAIAGSNVVINSPMNSGKTHMAVMICRDHLEKSITETELPTVTDSGDASVDEKYKITEEPSIQKPQKPKIIYMVPEYTILQQVLREFTSHLPLWNIGSRSSATTRRQDLSVMMEIYDIIIITAAILKNDLDNKKVHISDFSMLIFDECHHAILDHPYNAIMVYYLKEKYQNPTVKLPQIIGLTGTPTAGKKVELLSVKENILKLCANLDAHLLVTVKENVEELKEVVNTPPTQTRLATKRSKDPFSYTLKKIMQAISEYADLRKSIICDMGLPRYDSYIEEQKAAAVSDNNSKVTKCCDSLLLYNNALQIVDVAQFQDGFKKLRQFYSDLKTNRKNPDEAEHFLLDIFHKHEEQLKDLLTQDDEYPNPKLVELKKGMLEKMEDCKQDNVDFRAMIFVKTKYLTQTLKRWIKEDEELKFLNPAVLTGIHAKLEEGGMNPSDQAETISNFKSGIHKVLVSTSAGYHGIHIAECNMTITYNLKSDQISMNQSRGRARAAKSSHELIGDEEAAEKHITNIHLTKKIEEAIKELQIMDVKTFQIQIANIQKREYDAKIVKQKKKEEVLLSNDTSKYVLHCYRCEAFACNLDEIRKYHNSNHINPEESFKSKYNLKDAIDEKMIEMGVMEVFCAECDLFWGTTCGAGKYPGLGISNFTVMSEGSGGKQHKKWKNLKVMIPPV